MSKKAVLCLIAATVVLTFLFSLGIFSTPAFAKSRILKYGSGVPPKSWFAQQEKWWAGEVEKRTQGRLKIKIFWMGSLVKWKDMLHGIKSGILDIGVTSSTYHPSDFPLWMLLDMPYNLTDYYVGMMAALDTMENQPDLKKELDMAQHVSLGGYCSGQFQLATRKQFKTYSELKGKTFRTYGGARIKWMEFMGINPVFMSYADIYEALDRGTVFGSDLVFQLSDAFKHYEVAKFVSLANSGAVLAANHRMMNKKVFDSLPKDIQGILMKLRLDFNARYAKNLMDFESGVIENWRTKYGVTISELSKKDIAIAAKAGKDAQEWFIKKQESGGHPAHKVWNYYLNSYKKYDNEVKAKGYPWQR
ncbi:MAG: TRAP transporter substrate-binding protein DctP [Deltaproteobacteria bacterium]|nr:TRAP transporter substrate-binding protein DctP [Deltaproteobacteria bacterium]